MEANLLIEVTLNDFPGIESRFKIEAEQRFAKTLQRCFDSPTSLLVAHKAFIEASESFEQPKAEQASLATSWQKAYGKALEAGFRSLGQAEEAYFEVRIAA